MTEEDRQAFMDAVVESVRAEANSDAAPHASGSEAPELDIPADSVCQQAARLVYGQKRVEWGDPYESFRNIAAFWNTYLDGRLDPNDTLTPHDVALMMVLLKVSRLVTGSHAYDNYVDGSGYFELAHLLSKREREELAAMAREALKKVTEGKGGDQSRS